MRDLVLRLMWATLLSPVVWAGSQGVPPTVGDPAPAFNANTHDGQLWQTKDHREKGKYLIVYFYPAAMTGGCTKQACSYRDRLAGTDLPEVEIVGVSADPVANLHAFKKANELNFTLLSDVNGVIARRFGVPVKTGGQITRTIDGREVVFKRPYTLARWTFIVDKDGKVVYKDTVVNVDQDSRKALEFIKDAA
jgi:peroxiredoxin Q/BCP